MTAALLVIAGVSGVGMVFCLVAGLCAVAAMADEDHQACTESLADVDRDWPV